MHGCNLRRQTIFLLGLLLLTGFSTALLSISPTRGALRKPSVMVMDFQGQGLITYIANEGVLLEIGEKKVVIDGMFRQQAGYQRPSHAMRNDMENALGRFADVDLVLATHYHADHFDARVVRWHLAANPKAHFVAVRQVTDALAKEQGYDQVAPRVIEVTPDFGQRKEMRVSDITLSVIRMRHGNTMNAAFLLNLEGVKILHLGDSDGTVANFDALNLEKEGVAFALIPYWYALDDEGRRVIREHIAPKQVIFFHIPEDNPDHPQLKQHMDEMGGRAGLQKGITAEFPNALFLLDPLAPPRR